MPRTGCDERGLADISSPPVDPLEGWFAEVDCAQVSWVTGACMRPPALSRDPQNLDRSRFLPSWYGRIRSFLLF
jgi:hypothetical protein